MTEFHCLVLPEAGAPSWRIVSAGSDREAASVLRAQGLTALEIKAGSLSIADRLSQPIRITRGISLGDQALLLTQLSLLVRSGLPVDRSLDLLADQAARSFLRRYLKEVLLRVRGGSGLASALEVQKVFPGYVIGVVRSAERAGKLGDALGSLAERLSLASQMRRQLITALTYPAAVLGATLIALIIVLTMVVPQFTPIFEGQEEKVPALTRVVLALSAATTDYGFWSVLFLAAVITTVVLLWRTQTFSRALASNRQFLPGADLRDQYLSAQVLGLLSTLLANGISVLAALALARGAVSSRRWESYLDTAGERVRGGTSLSRALLDGGLIPNTAIRLIEVGERSGQLANTCGQASEILGQSARARIDRVVSLANPVAIILLGGVVASLVAGVMLGIFALGDFAGE